MMTLLYLLLLPMLSGIGMLGLGPALMAGRAGGKSTSAMRGKRIATASLRTGLAMTVVFYTLPFLLPIGTLCPLAPPQSAYG